MLASFAIALLAVGAILGNVRSPVADAGVLHTATGNRFRSDWKWPMPH